MADLYEYRVNEKSTFALLSKGHSLLCVFLGSVCGIFFDVPDTTAVCQL